MKLTFLPRSAVRLIIFLCVSSYLLLLSSCIKQTRSVRVTNDPLATTASFTPRPLVNINSASQDELETLPGIGPGLAMRIIEHRERYGRFRRTEHLIMVRGLSDRRFRELWSFVKAE